MKSIGIGWLIAILFPFICLVIGWFLDWLDNKFLQINNDTRR